jgi:hypothetical protein
MILITVATGDYGVELTKLLASRSEPARAVVRSAAGAKAIANLPGMELEVNELKYPFGALFKFKSPPLSPSHSSRQLLFRPQLEVPCDIAAVHVTFHPVALDPRLPRLRNLQRQAAVTVSSPGSVAWAFHQFDRTIQAVIAFSFATRASAAGLMTAPTPGISVTLAIRASSSGKAPLISAARADLPSAGN